METWRRNVYILWFAQFISMASISLVVPFLPLFVQELGVHDPDAVKIWSGLIFAANFFSAFIVSPMWGALADKYGRKMMLLRSGFGMSVTISLMGFATAPLHLLLLRFLNGTISGFIPAGISLVAANTPKEKAGYALGLLQSGAVAGSIMGPFIGGLLSEWIDYRRIFFITGAMMLFAAMMVMILVKEEFVKPAPKKKGEVGDMKLIFSTAPLPTLFLTGTLIQFSIMSTQPLMSLFVQELMPGGLHIGFFAGLAVAVTGFSNMLASPFLGRIADRKGRMRVLFYALIGVTIFTIPQAFVQSIWSFLIIRFLLGLCIGGLLPSLNSLIRQFAPEGKESTTFGYSNSALMFGNMLGPVVGGFLSGWIDIRGVFLLGAVLFAINTFRVRRIQAEFKAKHLPSY